MPYIKILWFVITFEPHVRVILKYKESPHVFRILKYNLRSKTELAKPLENVKVECSVENPSVC